MGEAGAHLACCLVGIPRPALEALFCVSLPSWTTERAVRPAFLPGASLLTGLLTGQCLN